MKWVKYFFILLTLSAFGPYVFKGIGVRLEHLIIYPAFSVATIFLLFNLHKYRLHKGVLVFSGFWFLVFSWISYISFGLGGGAISGGAVAVIDNFLLPISVIVLFIVFSRYYDLSKIFIPVTKVLLVGLGINSVIVIFQILIDPELFGVLDYFVRTRQETSVADRAATMGRYLGIYNQPIEAGASYTLGLLIWVYLENITNNFIGWLKYFILVLIFIGGLVSVSKVFVIGGLLLFIIYVLFYSRNKIRKNFLYAIPVVFGVVAYYLVTSMWSGLNYLLRLFRYSGGFEGLLAKYTANRFGSEEGAVKRVFSKVYNESPLYGFGFAPPPTLDNGFAEFFFHGGMIGLGIYIGLLFWLLYKGVEFYFDRGKTFVIFLFIVALIFGLNIGAPVFTLNRFSVHITLLVCFLLVGNTKNPNRCW